MAAVRPRLSQGLIPVRVNPGLFAPAGSDQQVDLALLAHDHVFQHVLERLGAPLAPGRLDRRLKRMLHEWDGVVERSRAEGEGQVDWLRSGPGFPTG